MGQVKIVTDSTADLPPEIARQLDITVVPLNVQFGGTVYRDGVDLTTEEFYPRLKASQALPTTSQPAAGVFTQAYEEIADKTDQILSIHISAKLSGTYNSAVLGKDAVQKSCRIEIVDSLQASMGLGLLAMAAARAAQKGKSLEETKRIVEGCLARAQMIGVVDTLEYLQKGGRIGKAQALLGSLLRVKPLVACLNGETHPLGRVRTWGKALDHLFEIVVRTPDVDEIAVLHSDNPDEADRFTERLKAALPQATFYRSCFGPVIGTYLGPGSLGIGLRGGKVDFGG